MIVGIWDGSMLYRNFAIATLLGAPLLVMVVEAVVP